MARTGWSEERRTAPRADRIRQIQGRSFGWIDARVLRDGWLQLLTTEAIAVYVFLCLAAGRDGVSYYRRDRIGHQLGLSDAAVSAALQRLIALELVAYRPFHANAVDGFHQVLELPSGGPPREAVLGVTLPGFSRPREARP